MNKFPLDLSIDVRDFHFHQAVGSVSPATFPVEYDADRDYSFPVQMGSDSRCTAIGACYLCTNQDGIEYSVDYQFMKTLLLMGLPPTHTGGAAREAFKVPIAWGMLPKQLEPISTESAGQTEAATPSNWPAALDAVAGQNKRPAFLRADTGPYDVFNNICSSFLAGKPVHRLVAIATPWYDEWENEMTQSGVLNESPSRKIADHLYVATGWTTHNTRGEMIRNGEPFLKLKTYNPRSWGDDGYCYASRKAVNGRFRQILNPSTWGSIALVFEKVDPETIDSLKNRVSLLTEILSQFVQNKIITLTK